MKLVRQPAGSDLCGQACIATLCNITLDEACMLVRTKGATRTKHLKRALRAMSVDHDERRKRGPLPQTALLYFQSKDRSAAHWVVWHKGKYYDPAAGVFRKLPRHLEDADLTSHLAIRLPYFAARP